MIGHSRERWFGWGTQSQAHLLALLIVRAEREHRVVEREVLVDSLFVLRRSVRDW